MFPFLPLQAYREEQWLLSPKTAAYWMPEERTRSLALPRDIPHPPLPSNTLPARFYIPLIRKDGAGEAHLGMVERIDLLDHRSLRHRYIHHWSHLRPCGYSARWPENPCSVSSAAISSRRISTSLNRQDGRKKRRVSLLRAAALAGSLTRLNCAPSRR